MLAYEGGGTGTHRFLMAALRPAQAVRVRGSVIGVSGEPGYEVVATINAYDEYGIPAPSNAGRFGYSEHRAVPGAREDAQPRYGYPN
jgi:hypothetical protein